MAFSFSFLDPNITLNSLKSQGTREKSCILGAHFCGGFSAPAAEDNGKRRGGRRRNCHRSKSSGRLTENDSMRIVIDKVMTRLLIIGSTESWRRQKKNKQSKNESG